LRNYGGTMTIVLCGSDCDPGNSGRTSYVSTGVTNVSQFVNVSAAIIGSVTGDGIRIVQEGDNYWYCIDGDIITQTVTGSGSCSASSPDYDIGCYADFARTFSPDVQFCHVYKDSIYYYPNVSCSFRFDYESDLPPPPPPCSDPVLIQDSRCKGGYGQWVADVDPVPWFAYYYVALTSWSESCEILTPNGTSCLLTGNSCYVGGQGGVYNQYLRCPSGCVNEGCSGGGVSSVSGGSSSSGSGSSSSGSWCSDPANASSDFCQCVMNPNLPMCEPGPQPDICEEFPNLPLCECRRNPSLPWCGGITPSSSVSGGGDGGSGSGGSSGSMYDPCEMFPTMWYCQGDGSSSGSGGGFGGVGSSSASGGNVGGVWSGNGNGGTVGGEGNDPTCLKNNNCNWARIDVQLTQLRVETQTRDLVRDIAALSQAGYNLTNEQNILLHSVLTAVSSGSADVVNAINSLASAVVSGSSDNFNSALSSWQDMMNNAFGSNGSKLDNIGRGIDSLKGGIAGGIADGLNKFAGDTSGSGAFAGSLGEYDIFNSPMGDSLGGGLGMKGKIKEAIGIDSSSFAFLGSSSVCPVWDFSFNWSVGRMHFSCGAKCKINICNIYGFNLGAFFRALIWLSAMVGILAMNLRVLQTGGH